jgi:hypothetical protein
MTPRQGFGAIMTAAVGARHIRTVRGVGCRIGDGT